MNDKGSMLTLLGKIDKFSGSKAEWPQYAEHVDHFFVNGIDDASKKKSAFLVMIGPATYALLRNHVSPDKPGDKSVGVLLKRYNPTLLELVQHSRFHSCFMKQGDTVATLVCELHSYVGRVL